MKRMLCGLLAILLVAGLLAGCKKQEEQQEDSPAPVNTSEPSPKQQEAYRIGLIQFIEYAPLDSARESFMSRLEEWGFDDGKVTIDYQNAGGDSGKADEICQQFVKNQVDVIVAISTPAAKSAVKAAGSGSTQVVFVAVGEPGTALEMKNPEQPDGNITGVADIVAAQAVVDLARQVDPGMANLGLLYDPSCTLGAAAIQAVKNYCGQLEIAVTEGQVSSAEEVKDKMAELCGQADAIFTPMDSTVAASAQDAAKAAQEGKKPWYVSTEDMVQQGAMAGVSIDYSEAGEKAADMAVQLVAGKSISQLPVYNFSGGRISVNQGAVTSLGAEIPEEVLETANFY